LHSFDSMALSPLLRVDTPAVPLAPRPATLEQLAALPDECIDLAVGAALVARDAYGALDIDAVVAQFGALAEPLRERDLGSLTAPEQADAISGYLHGTLGFRGNEQDYYDPRNSLLPDVLGRKLGIPITLALVYCEVARRVGVRARGVSFPGHFLVRIDGADAGDTSAVDGLPGVVAVDPFFGGRRLDTPGLQRLLKRAMPSCTFDASEHLAPAGARATLVRMLINLKWIYATRGDLARSLLALDRIITQTPDSIPAIRERAMLSQRLGAVEAARADLSRLLELSPDGADVGSIRARLEELRAKRTLLN
jgi:regulator of sirC expression with transglutaminase-like and TPR domain